MRIKRAGAILAAAVAISAGTSLTGTAVAGPAPPYNCHAIKTWSGNGGEAWCESGYGWARVTVVCANDANKRTTVYGPWKEIGYVSEKYCPSTNPYVISVGYQTRSL